MAQQNEHLVPLDSSRHRNYFSRDNFDDYSISLMAKIRFNEDADQLISGETNHPLVQFQNANQPALTRLQVQFVPLAELIRDPIGTYLHFMRVLGEVLAAAPAPVPVLQHLNAMDDLFAVHKRAQRHIYNTIVSTLQVGKSMHYARQVLYGSGLHLLNVIHTDNRRVNTRSLMALFSALVGFQMRSGESFDQFSRRMDLLIQRMLNWRPPVVLPDQLLLFCALRALPAVPFGPVRHIILASPQITYSAGMAMLSDVANTGAELIANTLGSNTSSAPKSSAVLCASDKPNCPPQRPQPKPTPRSKKKKKTPRGPSKACLAEGPCVHHGPKSFHATSECRDPTLSKRKRKPTNQTNKPLAGIAATPAPPTTTPPATTSTAFYTPMFMAKISRASGRFPRSQFSPSRHADHFHRGFVRHPHRSRDFDVASASIDTIDSCIRSYTQPIIGTVSRHHNPGDRHNEQRPRRRNKHFRKRNRRINRRRKHKLETDDMGYARQRPHRVPPKASLPISSPLSRRRERHRLQNLHLYRYRSDYELDRSNASGRPQWRRSNARAYDAPAARYSSSKGTNRPFKQRRRPWRRHKSRRRAQAQRADTHVHVPVCKSRSRTNNQRHPGLHKQPSGSNSHRRKRRHRNRRSIPSNHVTYDHITGAPIPKPLPAKFSRYQHRSRHEPEPKPLKHRPRNLRSSNSLSQNRLPPQPRTTKT